MHVLFFGGTGNISSACAALLHERGHQISVVTRGRNRVPPAYRAIVASRDDLGTVGAPLLDGTPEVVIDFLAYDLPDVRAVHQLFKGSIRQYVFVSSATVYAKPPPRLPLTEDTPRGNAYWDYAQKKLACELWLEERWRQDQFPTTIVRPSHTYSERWIPNPLSSSSYTFARRLEQGKPVYVPDDGENPWTLTAASDFAVGLAGLIGNNQAVGEAFHITSDEVQTWNEIVAEIARALAVERPRIARVPTDLICQVAPQLSGTLKGDKAHPGVFDNSKVKRFVPSFECRKPFRRGVRESVVWLRDHPEQQNLNPRLDELCDRIIAAGELGKARG